MAGRRLECWPFIAIVIGVVTFAAYVSILVAEGDDFLPDVAPFVALMGAALAL